jgi:tripartite-type tricarboxylate transporter receptor subunit TctC
MFEQLPTILPQITSGRLRPLGVTSKTRAPALPNVPTIAESGVPGYESTAWFTIATSARVPGPIVQKLNADLNAVLASPEVQSKLKDLGMNAVGGSTDSAVKYFASETEKWTRVIRVGNLKVD